MLIIRNVILSLGLLTTISYIFSSCQKEDNSRSIYKTFTTKDNTIIFYQDTLIQISSDDFPILHTGKINENELETLSNYTYKKEGGYWMKARFGDWCRK